MTRGGSTGKSVPDAELGGSYPKFWVNKDEFHKLVGLGSAEDENKATRLARLLGIPCNETRLLKGKLGVAVLNISNITSMMLTLRQAGIEAVGSNYRSVLGAYAKLGITSENDRRMILQTILFDGIVANFDRQDNSSNWGYMVNPDTGVKCVSPMYDFNLCYSKLEDVSLRLDRIKRGVSLSDRQTVARWVAGIDKFGERLWSERARLLLLK
jgi:hypothetical protein